MGAIPPIQRARLVSQNVGTPGVDTSAAAIGGTVAKTAFSIADDIAKRDAELAKAESRNRAKINALRDETSASLRASEYHQSVLESRKTFKNLKDFRENAEKLRQDMMSQIESPDELRDFVKETNTLLKSQSKEVADDEREDLLLQAKANFDNTVEKNASILSDTFKNGSKTYEQKLTTLQELLEASEGVAAKFSGEGADPKELEKARKAMTSLYLNEAVQGFVQTSPKDLERFLDSGLVDDEYNAEEINELRKTANDYAETRLVQIKKQKAIDKHITTQQTVTDFLGGEEIDVTKIDTLVLRGRMDATTAKLLKDTIKSQRAAKANMFAGDNPASAARIIKDFADFDGGVLKEKGASSTFSTDISRMRSDSKAAKKYGTISFAQAAGMYQRALEFLEQGGGSSEDAKALINRTVPIFNREVGKIIDDRVEEFNKNKGKPLDHDVLVRNPAPDMRATLLTAHEALKNVAPTKQQLVQLKGMLGLEMLKAMDAEEQKLQRELTDVQRTKLLTKVARNFNFKTQLVFSDLDIDNSVDNTRESYPLNSINTLNGKEFKVVGFHPFTGKPMVVGPDKDGNFPADAIEDEEE